MFPASDADKIIGWAKVIWDGKNYFEWERSRCLEEVKHCQLMAA